MAPDPQPVSSSTLVTREQSDPLMGGPCGVGRAIRSGREPVTAQRSLCDLHQTSCPRSARAGPFTNSEWCLCTRELWWERAVPAVSLQGTEACRPSCYSRPSFSQGVLWHKNTKEQTLYSRKRRSPFPLSVSLLTRGAEGGDWAQFRGGSVDPEVMRWVMSKIHSVCYSGLRAFSS